MLLHYLRLLAYIYNKLEQSPEGKIEELITDFINKVKEDYKIELEDDFCF